MHQPSAREVPRCRTNYQITLRQTDSTSETYICFTRPTRGVRKARLCGGCSTNARAARYFSNRAAVIARCSRTGAGCRTITYIAGWLRAPNCINTSSSRPGAKAGRYWVLHGRGKGCGWEHSYPLKSLRSLKTKSPPLQNYDSRRVQ